MHPSKKWHYETLGKAAVETLKRNGFDAVYVDDSDAARQVILSMIPPGASVGFGGSVTLGEIGLLDQLHSADCRLINPPWVEGATPQEQRLSMRREAMHADVFLTGTNAITLDGKLVNTDATGNRLAGMTFGPNKSIVVAGANKIVRTLDEALQRVSRVAAPANAKRLHCDTPCAVTGICSDCRSADRICNATLILHKKTRSLEIAVVIVGEELGL